MNSYFEHNAVVFNSANYCFSVGAGVGNCALMIVIPEKETIWFKRPGEILAS